MEIPSLEQGLWGRVAEVAPAADPVTRGFLVKVELEPAPGPRAGMFGRLLLPLKERPAVPIPRQALRRVGQLELVRVLTPSSWQSVYVTTGRQIEGRLEVLSGLKGGETLAPAGGGDES